MKTITFCGHRKISETEKENIKQKLKEEIEKLILKGAKEFLLGGYGDFDYMCAKTVRELKKEYPHIKGILVSPYLNRECDKDLYDDLEYADVEKTPLRFAIVKRNEYMVKKADLIICYVKYSWGGAAKTRDYAIRKGKKIIDF